MTIRNGVTTSLICSALALGGLVFSSAALADDDSDMSMDHATMNDDMNHDDADGQTMGGDVDMDDNDMDNDSDDDGDDNDDMDVDTDNDDDDSDGD